MKNGYIIPYIMLNLKANEKKVQISRIYFKNNSENCPKQKVVKISPEEERNRETTGYIFFNYLPLLFSNFETRS